MPRNHFADYATFIHRLAGHLSKKSGHEVKYALINSDPQLATKPFDERARLCYLWDTKMVQDADVMVAECSFPSIGLGIELQVAAEKEIPVILAFKDFHDNHAEPVKYINPDKTQHDLQIGQGIVSLMALGVPTIFKVHRYVADDDGIIVISESIKLLEH